VGGRLFWFEVVYMKARWIGMIAALAMLGLAVSILALPSSARLKPTAAWRLASPGGLSTAHAFLENDCAACHTAVEGVEAANCIVCHANNESLLQRQPTAFHGGVGSCRECHPGHLKAGQPPTTMSHAALAKIGLRQLENKGGADTDTALLRDQVVAWISRQQTAADTTGYSHITPLEATLRCAECHSIEDRHFAFFGQDCGQCHATTQWTIPEFQHPSPRSTDCAQCHQAPPSHYMGHFHMVSAKVAVKPHAQVSQCYACHQNTAWNDIKGVGWYKHH
jgi:hypothetical protein